MNTLTQKEIDDHVERIRKNASGAVERNYFKQAMKGEAFSALSGAHTLLFLDPDLDFHHLFFVTSDTEELKGLLEQIERKPLTIDYITKSPSPPLLHAFEGAGFSLRAVYKRLFTNQPRRVKSQGAEFARESESQLILERLFSDFDKYCHHFPLLEELRAFIAAKQVLVTRKEGGITGYFIYQVTGMRCHMNYWYNDADSGPIEGLNLLLQFYAEISSKDIKMVYAWVNRDNAKVMRIHEQCGLSFDGFYDYIFLR
jgi:hypothetical protein